MNDKPKQYCDECGRAVTRYHRVHDGQGFCNSCYSRVFTRHSCQNCSKSFREHPTITKPFCRKCRPIFIPCIRCSKLKYEVGRVTRQGPVCKCCAIYFRDEKACASCGKLSFSLSRSLSRGFYQPTCINCLSKAFSKCDNCDRKRSPIYINDGVKLCSKCLKSKLSICPHCGLDYPSGTGICCKNCYFTRLLGRKVKITKELYDSNKVQSWFEEFSLWLAQSIGPAAAASKINHYSHFFKVIDENPKGWSRDLFLLARLTKGELRKDGNPLRFFKTKNVLINPILILRISDYRSIYNSLNILNKQSSKFGKKILTDYCQLSLQKMQKGKIKERTLKQQLTSVVSLIDFLKNRKLSFDQKSLDQFLDFKPGLTASLSTFITHIKKSQINVRIVNRNKKQKTSKQALIDYIEKGLGNRKPSKSEVIACLVYFHKVPLEVAKSMKPGSFITSKNGDIVVSNKKFLYKITFTSDKS